MKRATYCTVHREKGICLFSRCIARNVWPV